MRFLVCVFVAASAALASVDDLVPGDGWPTNRHEIWYANYWDQFSGRNYNGFNHAFMWPGGWWDLGANDPVERRTYANYRGFVIGATNVHDPQYPEVIWPYMVGQRDGWNDGENGTDILDNPPDPLAISKDVQFLFKGRLSRRTFRQRYAAVTTNGVASPYLRHDDYEHYSWPQLVGDESDNPYQQDQFDPDLPADVTMETYSWTRMGVSNSRMVYAFVDRRNDDYMFWHLRLINDGRWTKMGVAPPNRVDCCGGTHGTVEGVMFSMMFQWGRGNAGAARTNSSGERTNDTIWRYYGVDYDGAQTQDMRLVYVIDGDQDPSVYSPAHGKQDDIGDPDPTTGDLLNAKTAGWQILHYDRSPTDGRDDPAQPRTVGWQNYEYVIRTGTENINVAAGHEAKYNQMLLGYQAAPDEYYPGDVQSTPGRGTHPFAGQGASWIKASNDPATSGAYWPGKVLGVSHAVTDVEQQAGFGPDDLAPYDTVNAVFALGIKGLDEPYAIHVGREWLAGALTDGEKDSLVHSTIDSLFQTMRQAKAVYESAQFDDGFGGIRYASSRAEFEESLRSAIDAGRLALSPPAPATFAVQSWHFGNKVDMSWTLNTTTGSDIAGWRVYRAIDSVKGDSAWTLVYEGDPEILEWSDSTPPEMCHARYYYLTTFDSEGHESTMHTRTSDPAFAFCVDDIQLTVPSRFYLGQNAPNPLNPQTAIRYEIADADWVDLSIWNCLGQHVRTLENGFVEKGRHEVSWDGTDDAGRAVASGTYLYRLTSGANVEVRRMTVIR